MHQYTHNGSPRKREREKWTNFFFKEIMDENFVKSDEKY